MSNLRAVYTDKIIERGKSYSSNVDYCIKIRDFLYAEVRGTSLYKTKVDLKTLNGNCSCPYGANCKHAVAAYLAYKKGNHVNAGGFIKHLNSLSKRELIKIITDNLHNNPDIALNYNLKKSTNFGSFVNDFIDDFSYLKFNKAQRLISNFIFEQLVRMLCFLRKNEDVVFDKIYKDYWEYDDEGDILYDFESELEKEIVKKISTEEELKKAIQLSLHDKITADANSLLRFKNIVKPNFSKDQFLEFLLNLREPDLDEIKENLTKNNRALLFLLPYSNIDLAEKISKYLKDKSLLFLVAVYKKDYDGIVEYFSEFDKTMKINSFVLGVKLADIIDLFIKNNFQDKNVAMKLLKKEFLYNYGEKHLKYLLNQICDFDYMREQLDFGRKFSQNLPLLERLFCLNKTETKELIDGKKDILKNRHWTEIVEILNFLRKKSGNNYIRNLIEDNEDIFKTNSTLKSNLKEEKIFIKNVKGNFIVEVS